MAALKSERAEQKSVYRLLFKSRRSGSKAQAEDTVSAGSQSLQKPNGQASSSYEAVLEEQLRDALEKNQQWLVYDQQRENYVQSAVARIMELEQQLAQAKEQLQAKQLDNRHPVSEETRVTAEPTDRMDVQLDTKEIRQEEEEERLKQKSLNEEQRLTALKKQLQLSNKALKNEMIFRQSMDQLHKTLKELRKAYRQIYKLKSAKWPPPCVSKPTSYSDSEFKRLAIADRPGQSYQPPKSSSSKVISLVDENFLECPKCQASYVVRDNRQLLAHIDYCLA